MTNPDRSELLKLAATIEAYGFECEGGPLKNCKPWMELKRRLASSDGEVKVRELEWRNHSFDGDELYIATWGDYCIHKDATCEWPYVIRPFISGQSNFQTLDAAKAAAQRDYETRIKSALVEVPAVKGEPEPVAWPANLNPRTLDLVQRFALALAKKLRLAEEKYGHTDGWLRDDWEAECRDHLYQHLEKGDPRDVAAYCAFMWHHGWITYQPLFTAPPADAGMREALELAHSTMESLRVALRDDPAVHDRKWIPHGIALNAAIRKADNALADAALTAPGATTKSDGGEVITAEQMDAIEKAAVAGRPLTDPDWKQDQAETTRIRLSDPSSTRSDVTVVERVAQTIREYCIGVSPASIQLSHGVERIYYAGLPVLELARAILATGLVPDEAAVRADEREKMQAEIDRLNSILNTPILEPFAEAVAAEARHQIYRWGEGHDAKKTAWDWFWTLGHLSSKAAHSALAGDFEKAKHHTVTAAAMLSNWRRHICAAAIRSGGGE